MNKKINPYIVALLALFTSLPFLYSSCTSVAVSKGITAISEIAAGNALQHKVMTVAQLNTLATDLGAFPNTPLPQADTGLIANLVTELTAQRAANLTDASAVDAINQAISALNMAGSPTAWQGIAWANLQDVVSGLKAEVLEAQQNPSLVPQ